MVNMVREWLIADLDAWIEDSRWIKALLHTHEEVIQFGAEHRLHIFGAHPAISVFSTDRATEAAQDRLVNLVIALHHLLEIVLVVQIEQGTDLGVPISEMT